MTDETPTPSDTPAAAADESATDSASVETTASAAGDTTEGAGSPEQDTEEAAGAQDETAESTGDADSSTTEFADEAQTDEEKQLYASLPPEIKKKLDKHFTQKSQRVAAKARELESHQALISALQSDPKGTVAQIAKQLGLQIAEPSPVNQAQNKLTELFGDEAAKALGPVLRDIVEESVAPIKKQHEDTLAKAAFASAQAAHDTFKQNHPDYKKYERAMLDQSKFLEAKPGMKEIDYLETLYFLATRDKGVAAEAKKAINRMTKSAAKSEPKSPAIPPSRVAPGPPQAFPTLEQAAAAAKRGEVWE